MGTRSVSPCSHVTLASRPSFDPMVKHFLMTATAREVDNLFRSTSRSIQPTSAKRGDEFKTSHARIRRLTPRVIIPVQQGPSGIGKISMQSLAATSPAFSMPTHTPAPVWGWEKLDLPSFWSSGARHDQLGSIPPTSFPFCITHARTPLRATSRRVSPLGGVYAVES